jgi:hypothetical protein
MRKYLFLFVLVFAVTSYSQTITFCEGVTEKGAAKNASEVFNISSKGGYFYFLVHLPYKVNCYKQYFDIYSVEEGYETGTPGDGETFEATIETDTQPDWTWFYKQVTFYKPGYYRVYVRDCEDGTYTVGAVQVNYK